MSGNFQALIHERLGGVDWLTLNRPERLNAINGQLLDELSAYFREIATCSEVRVIALRGAGRAFCAGMDITPPAAGGEHLADHEVEELYRSQQQFAGVMLAMRRCPQPIVSLIQGAASGAGFALALAADFRIAAPDARFNCAYIRIGAGGCDMGSSYFLLRLVGGAVAAELMFTGKFIAAERALAVGLVSRIVDHGELLAAAEEEIAAMLETTPFALRLTKECYNFALDAPSLEAAMAMENRNQVLATRSADFPERLAALNEKRSPRWVAKRSQ